MKLYAPKYYKEFSCIAEKCDHNCCIGWEIDIDSETMKKYSDLGAENSYGNRIKMSIELCETPRFRLGKDEKCPHLDDRGLCRIIKELGEEYLCEICREHPRFYNDSVRGKEVGLGMACREACRIILSSEEYDEIAKIGEPDVEVVSSGFDTLALRSRIYEILKDGSHSYEEKLEMIWEEFEISPQIINDDEWRKILLSLEYLDDAHKSLFSKYSSDIKTPAKLQKAAERALAYFVYRHCTEAFCMDDYRASLGFSLFCERLLISILKSENVSDAQQIIITAAIISEELEYSEENTEKIKDEMYFNMQPLNE